MHNPSWSLIHGVKHRRDYQLSHYMHKIVDASYPEHDGRKVPAFYLPKVALRHSLARRSSDGGYTSSLRLRCIIQGPDWIDCVCIEDDVVECFKENAAGQGNNTYLNMDPSGYQLYAPLRMIRTTLKSSGEKLFAGFDKRPDLQRHCVFGLLKFLAIRILYIKMFTGTWHLLMRFTAYRVSYHWW